MDRSGRQRLRSWVIALLLGALPLGGCVAPQAHFAPCSSLHCLALAQTEELTRTCVKDLFTYEPNRRRQPAIDSRYRYPFVSWRSYSNWRRFGGDGPTPLEWCRDYAEHQVRPRAYVGR